MSRILCTHVDLDGIGSLVLSRFFEDKYQFEDILMLDYGFEEDERLFSYISEFDEIVIADLTVPEEKIEPLISKNKKVIIYDHHAETSWIQEYTGSVWDQGRCGTKIFWEEYLRDKIGRYPAIIDHFVELVNTYDQWNQDHDLWEDAKNLNSVLYGIKNYREEDEDRRILPFVDLMHKKFSKLSEWRNTEKEKYILERDKKKEEEMLSRALGNMSYRKDNKGKKFGVCQIPSKVSVTASKILEKDSSLDYLIVVNTYQGLTGKLSFRSRNGFNCNDICVAKGHDAAAGGMISEQDLQEFVTNKSLSFRYNDEYDEDAPNQIFNGITYL